MILNLTSYQVKSRPYTELTPHLMFNLKYILYKTIKKGYSQ